MGIEVSVEECFLDACPKLDLQEGGREEEEKETQGKFGQ